MSNEFKGYILQVKVNGRTELHEEISRMTEEDYKQFIESINEELSCIKYFMWVDSLYLGLPLLCKILKISRCKTLFLRI